MQSVHLPILSTNTGSHTKTEAVAGTVLLIQRSRTRRAAYDFQWVFIHATDKDSRVVTTAVTRATQAVR
jgi:hypothetical protein